jgi:trk system potassium uptake protein TrkH
MGGRLSIKHRMLIQESFSQFPLKDMFHLLRLVISFTLMIEFLGALALYGRFVQMFPPAQAAYHAIFHSVSAFCNAGFSLYETSFIAFQNDMVVNGTMTAMIIIGGLGFFVLADLNLMERLSSLKRPKRFSLHTKIVFAITALLILTGTLLVLLLEWRNGLAGLPLWNKVVTSFFQSVTARTAGFNTMVTGNLTNPTLFLLIVFMFIGASPGSTGGGIKTSTLGILIALVISRLKGRRNVELFRRSVPLNIVGKAVSVAALGIITIALGTMLLSVTEGKLLIAEINRGRFLELLFETTSAFGTVGLSTGVTPNLTVLGKFIVIITIFIGRIGPLSLALAVGQRISRRHYEFPEENVMVG